LAKGLAAIKNHNGKKSKNRKSKVLLKVIIAIIIIIVLINGFSTPIPAGISIEGTTYDVSNIEFLQDLTYKKDGELVHEQVIFNEQLKLIKNAREFVVVDMFLFNDDYDRKNSFPKISEGLTTTLINQKKKYPNIKIYFITDEINNFYGSFESKYITELKENNIDVIITDSTKIRDSNPLYSGFWRTFLKWFKTSGKGWLPNPFSPDSQKVTLRGYLKLLNFKANHRKTLITEEAAIIASANPHDASGYHSNIAFKLDGEIINDLVKSELAVVQFSGSDFDEIEYVSSEETTAGVKATLLTEGKIKKHIVKEIKDTKAKDKISLAMFYLSDRSIVKELINAANRGVDIKLVLDANKDAFGIEKNGIPNRQVASELVKKSDGKINVKWYDTNGEQFHTKLIFIEKDDKGIIIGGSANFTRRNLDDYNLETDVKIEIYGEENELATETSEYFNRIWNNEDGQYTSDYSKYQDDSFIKKVIYRFQEFSGLCTF